jgi:hypothetical protein
MRLDLEHAIRKKAAESSSNLSGTEEKSNSKSEFVSLVEQTEIENRPCKKAGLQATEDSSQWRSTL